MSDTATEIAIPDAAQLAELRTYTNDDVNAVTTFDEAIAASGLNTEDIAFLASPFRVLTGDEKSELIGVPFLIKSWRFAVDQKTDRPYVVAHAITKNNDMVILTDGSTGIHRQLATLTAKRIGEGHPTPAENALILNGLRVSEYDVTADGKPAKPGEKVDSTARTYYLA